MRPHLAAEQARGAAARGSQFGAERVACRLVQKALNFQKVDHLAKGRMAFS
jgi:hypothetical protein